MTSHCASASERRALREAAWKRRDEQRSEREDRVNRFRKKKDELLAHLRRLQERWPSLAGLDGPSPESRAIDDWNEDRSSLIVALDEWLVEHRGIPGTGIIWRE